MPAGQLGRLHPFPHGGTGRHRFLPRLGAHLARLGNLLCIVLSAYVLFFLHLETRRVTLAGITQHPTEDWMVQMARRAVDPIDGALLPIRFVLHDRDTKFCAPFRNTLRSAGVRPLALPARSPNLNSFAERWFALSKANVYPSSSSSAKARCVEQ